MRRPSSSALGSARLRRDSHSRGGSAPDPATFAPKSRGRRRKTTPTCRFPGRIGPRLSPLVPSSGRRCCPHVHVPRPPSSEIPRLGLVRAALGPSRNLSLAAPGFARECPLSRAREKGSPFALRGSRDWARRNTCGHGATMVAPGAAVCPLGGGGRTMSAAGGAGSPAGKEPGRPA